MFQFMVLVILIMEVSCAQRRAQIPVVISESDQLATAYAAITGIQKDMNGEVPDSMKPAYNDAVIKYNMAKQAWSLYQEGSNLHIPTGRLRNELDTKIVAAQKSIRTLQVMRGIQP